MKISSLIIMTILGCQGIAGCKTFNSEGKDTCGRQDLAKFVGTSFDDLITMGHFNEKHGTMDDGSGFWEFDGRTYLLEVFDQRDLLPGEDRVVLANFSPQRLRIYVGNDGNIDENFKCG